MLQQSDIDALVIALNASQEGSSSQRGRAFSEIKNYDFARPYNLPSQFIRALENINAEFARALTGIFTAYLTMGVQVEPLSIDQMTYRQFCNSVPDITAMCTFSLAPLDGTALFEINPHLAWYLIDRGLGGQGEVIETPRDFSSLEKGLLDDLFRRIIRELGKCWGILAPINPIMREVSTSPMVTRIAQPDDRMVTCSFGITLPGLTGVSTYTIPVNSMDFERLFSPDNSWDDAAEDTEEQDRLLVGQNTALIPVTVRACFPDVRVTLRELASMAEGDILYLDTRVDDPVEVRIESERLFLAQPVTMKDIVAVNIMGDVSEDGDGRDE